MKNKTLLFISFLLISICLDAQREGYNWHFGSNAYVDFNTVPPTPYATSNMDQREGCASISSPSGTVLFYTDGVNVWDVNDNPMPSVPFISNQGVGGIGGSSQSAQSSIIVPVPSQTGRYYIFTVGDWQAGPGLSYSLVDMSLNGGLGDLIYSATSLNVLVREQVTSVEGLNGDVWIVSHERGNNNRDYVVYNITSAGVLNPNPVRTSVGMFYGGGNRYGYLKFSQDGNKLCNTFGSMNSYAGATVQLLDFNKATGVLSNPITLGTTTPGDIRFAYSSEFSPDNTKLYVAEFGRNDIFQFDISLASAVAIQASRINIGTGPSLKNCLQIGPCNRIYVSGQNNTFLGVINFPDNAGAACDFDEQGLPLANNSNAMLGLPNFKRSFFAFPNLGQDTAICSGQTLALNSNMLGAIYLWNTGSTQPSININSTGLYTVNVSAYGCEYSDSIYVRVNPSPVATANNNGPLCVGDQLLLTGGSGGLSYSWSGPSTYNSVSQSPVVGAATTAMSGSYSLVVTDVNSCSSVLTTNVSVNALPSVNAGVDDSICVGGSVGLVASGATAYSWNNSGSLTSSVISNPTASPSTTTTYTLTGSDANQCVNTDNVTVTVNANPVATANNNGPLCVGDQLILTGGSNGLSYSWSGPNTYSSGSQSPVISGNAISTMAGTYTLTVSDGNKCTGLASTTIVVNANPVVTANNNGPLCVGDQLILTGGSNGLSYSWGGPSAYNSVSQSPVVGTATIVMAGSYSLVVTDVNNCSSLLTTNVTVNALPNVSAGADQAICDGNGVVLSASGATTYLWNNSGSLTSSAISSPTANPSATTTYTLTGTDANQCVNTDNVTVTVNALPNVSAGADQAICDGDSVGLLASGASTYSWSDSVSLSSSNVSSPTANPSTTTTYTLTGGNGTCINTDSVTVRVNALPNVSAGADQAICDGDSVMLSGSGAMSYSWDNGVLDGVSFIPVAGTIQYALTGTDTNGCVGSSSVNVVVNTFDLPSISDTTYCYGSDKLIDLGQYDPQNIVWTPNNGVVVIPGHVLSFSPFMTTTYMLSVADSNGCVDSESFNIEVVDSIDLQLSGDTAVCPNEDVDLFVNGATNPTWSNGELATSINVLISSDTFFTATASNICGSVSKTVYVNMYGLPYIDAGNDQQINYGQNTQLNATVNNVSGYSWTPAYYLDNSSIEDPMAEPEETTTFVLSVVSSNGCESNDTMTVYVEEEKVVRVPTAFTPNDDGKNDIYFISGKGICDLSISIFNRWGELVFQGSGIDASWDGTYNDEKQPLETYAVLVDVEFCDQSQESFRNNITLIR